MLVDLSYVDHYSFGSAAAWADRTMNISSAFDPDFTGAGHQPRYFDQLSAIYSAYRVLWVDYEITVACVADIGVACTLIPSTQGGALTAAGFPEELPGASKTLVTGNYQPPCRFVGRAYPHRIWGTSAQQWAIDDNSVAYIGASPTNLTYLHIYAASMDGSTNVAATCQVRLNFKCEMLDRPNIGSS
jgi:hypothetical protein